MMASDIPATRRSAKSSMLSGMSPPGRNAKQCGQSMAWGDEVGEGVSIEHSHEHAERLIQHAFKQAGAADRTALGVAEDRHQIQVEFSPPHDCAKVDIRRRSRQAYAPVSTPCGLDVPCDTQLVD